MKKIDKNTRSTFEDILTRTISCIFIILITVLAVGVMSYLILVVLTNISKLMELLF